MSTEMDRLFSRIADEHYPDRHTPGVRHVNYAALTKGRREIETALAAYPPPLMVPASPAMQQALRIGPWGRKALADHDPGDEDRSER